MYEVSNPIRIKDLIVFNIPSCVNMMEQQLSSAYMDGVNIGDLTVNEFIYETDDFIIMVEYIKSLCNLVHVFKNILDNLIYKLRVYNFVDNAIYSNINFHKIFDLVNIVFNILVDDQYLLDAFDIYYSEISLDISMVLYDKFIEGVIHDLKDTVDENLLKFIFTKNNLVYLQDIYESITNQIQNVFLTY